MWEIVLISPYSHEMPTVLMNYIDERSDARRTAMQYMAFRPFGYKIIVRKMEEN